MHEIGEFVTLNGRIGVVVQMPHQPGADLYDHLAVWFDSFENGRPEIWTVPAEYFLAGESPIVKH